MCVCVSIMAHVGVVIPLSMLSSDVPYCRGGGCVPDLPQRDQEAAPEAAGQTSAPGEGQITW